jgi:hypothetical protein
MDNKEYIDREFAARAKAEADAKALLDRAATETRDLSPEEEEQFDRLVAASGRHKDRIEQLTRMDAAANLGGEVRAISEAAASLESPNQ